MKIYRLITIIGYVRNVHRHLQPASNVELNSSWSNAVAAMTHFVWDRILNA